jgi:predicted MFS family arabinose efflux permease
MQDSFGYGSAATGAFGILGIVGAFAATFVGEISSSISNNSVILVAAIILIISWVVLLFSGNSLIGLMIGVLLVDLGLQSLHITNQKNIFSKNPDARNRVNTIYMIGFFIGGALGIITGALAWEHYKWTGVSVLGIVLSLSILFARLLLRKI